jgi:hypothetical protein
MTDCAADMRQNSRTDQDRAICLPDFHRGRRLEQFWKSWHHSPTSLRDPPVTQRHFPAAISIKNPDRQASDSVLRPAAAP